MPPSEDGLKAVHFLTESGGEVKVPKPAKPPKRLRLDQRLVAAGLAPSRERAQALILAGQVVVGDHVALKAGQPVDESAPIRLKGEPMPWVSRGGLKLVHALDAFAIDVTGCDALDVGASTGGFTDVLLQRGARAVCAIDVGHGQLAWKLRTDPRVIAREKVNARHLDPATLPFPPEVIVCDVSFISLDLVLPRLVAAAAERGRVIVCLVKPQFEVGKAEVGKGGVVRDEGKRRGALAKITALARTLGCEVIGEVESPIEGPAGNREYLLVLRPPGHA
ncbi:MAG: TlyA family RNA methyltransferase [Myxococcales bacterium]|nr:TlyA family RNA methyltransferase [Myxococcales bacterium]